MEPTTEQEGAREVFASGRDLALVAGAGTGKTATLVMMGASTKRRGLYIAFNKAIAQEARKRFGPNVECRTAHSVAFRAVGYRYKDRLAKSARIPAREAAKRLGITRDQAVGSHHIRVNHQARLVMGMLRRFCYSTDPQLMARHAEYVNGLDPAEQEWVARTLLPYAEKAWDDVCRPDGQLRFDHDHYLKMWALERPQLRGDFVLLDEAQDTNPVLEEVFLAQQAQRVCVGDPAQQIYAWRSARDVMTGFPAEQLPLTQSFRFGRDIAQVANRWLGHAESDMELAGCGTDGSRLGEAPVPDAVLCRGNADAMGEVLHFLKAGIPVALTGGGEALRRIAVAADELKAGKRTSHPELFLFHSWDEVQEYAEHDKAGQDLKAIVGLVDKYGTDAILHAVDSLSEERHARVTVSTAHKAKGREWHRVRIGKGFKMPSCDDEGTRLPLRVDEARLIYVAVSRARHLLDTTGVAWVDQYERERAAAGSSGALVRLPVTGQLRHEASPVSRFMSGHLPGHRAVVGDYLTRVADLPRPVQPVDVRSPNWAALGHTVDYHLRLSLGGDLGRAVTIGVDTLDGSAAIPGAPVGVARAAMYAAGKELLEVIDRHLTGQKTLREEVVTRLCYVASLFEDIYRTGEVRRSNPLASADATITLADLAAAVPAYVTADIDQQLSLAEEAFAAFRALPVQQRICGPEFAGSRDLGGADADFILNGLLLDCKATTMPQRLGREEIYQLATYLLLDYDDQYGIDAVGIYLPRQGGLITWSVEEFLHRLGARQSLDRLRTMLSTHLREVTRALRQPSRVAGSVPQQVRSLVNRLLDPRKSPRAFD